MNKTITVLLFCQKLLHYPLLFSLHIVLADGLEYLIEVDRLAKTRREKFRINISKEFDKKHFLGVM